ncbi:hypothetical protein I549_3626 [Mycobacterium avium subsp. avium 2285 (R)]|nr:hypothetical protein I549_3626 [Mycobacterium avium subsp. avium 2285 (R)]
MRVSGGKRIQWEAGSGGGSDRRWSVGWTGFSDGIGPSA